MFLQKVVRNLMSKFLVNICKERCILVEGFKLALYPKLPMTLKYRHSIAYSMPKIS